MNNLQITGKQHLSNAGRMLMSPSASQREGLFANDYQTVNPDNNKHRSSSIVVGSSEEVWSEIVKFNAREHEREKEELKKKKEEQKLKMKAELEK